MKYQKLGDFIYLPEADGIPLKKVENIKFNYYLSSRINGTKIDLDITTKLFNHNNIYVRKACFRVNVGEIENCVKHNLIDHMRRLGMDDNNIPASLIRVGVTDHDVHAR